MRVFQPGDRVVDDEEYGETLCVVVSGTETEDRVEHELEVIRTISPNRFGRSHKPGLRYTHSVPKMGVAGSMVGNLSLAPADLN